MEDDSNSSPWAVQAADSREGGQNACSIRDGYGQGFEQVQQQLQSQLSTVQEQYHLKQQEVELLQAQVQRLSSVSSSQIQAVAPDSTCDSLQQQLDAALSELHTTRELLEKLMQQGAAAAQAAGEVRAGAIKLLLAQQLQELRNAEAQREVAQQLAADKEEDCEALRKALAAANAHILTLSVEQPQSQHSFTANNQESSHEQEDPSAYPPAETNTTTSGATPAPSDQQKALLELQHQLSLQRQQLEVAHQQVKDLAHYLALKHDCVAFAERRAELLEQQLASAQQQASDATAAAAATAAASAGHSDVPARPDSWQLRLSSAVEAEEAEVEAAGPGEVTPRQQQLSLQPQQAEQQIKPLGLAGSFSAALSNAASGLGLQHEQADRQHAPAPMSPFALARNFVAGREAEALSRLKEELREREQEVDSLTASNNTYETHIDGLQTILITKVSQCNRLDKELKDAHRQLRQAEAAAAAAQQVLGQQLGQLSEQVAELQDQLETSQQRERHARAQLAAARTKLAQVLEALMEDAAALQRHNPTQYQRLAADMPAALASVAALLTSAQPQQSTCSSHSLAVQPNKSVLPAARAASVLAASTGFLDGGPGAAGRGSTWAAAEAACDDGEPSAAVAGAKRFGFRSFMHSRTVSSHVGGCSSSGSHAEGWGRCVSASVHVQPHKPGGTGLQEAVDGTGSAAAAGATAAPPSVKQSAAAKLLEAFKIGRKGRETEEVDVVVSSHGRTSSDHGYVLLNS